MATTRKKSTARRPAAKKTSSRRKSTAQKKTASAGVPRGVWALFFAVLGIITLLSLFESDGSVLRWLHQICSGAFGLGLYALPFAFFGLCALFLIQRKGPIRLRTVGILLTPILIGGILHAIQTPNAYPLAMKTFSMLIASGMLMNSGGLLGGSVYIVLEWAFSSIGALLLLLLLLLVDLLVIFRLTPAAIWQMLKSPEYEYADEEEERRYAAPRQLPNLHEKAALRAEKRAQRAEKKTGFALRRQIDIPVDGAPVEAEAASPRKKAPSPAEYLEGLAAQDNADKDKKNAFSDILQLIQKKPSRTDSEPAPAPADKQSLDNDMEPLTDESDEPVRASSAPFNIDDEPDTPAAPVEKSERDGQAENAALAQQMDESQKMPVPAYVYPPLSLLQKPENGKTIDPTAELAESSQRLVETLQSFKIDAKIINIVRGPSVTRYEITISRGTKFSSVTNLSEDIALSLGAVSVRIAPIPDKIAIGIEVPNKQNETVYIRDVISSRAFQSAQSRVSFAVGKDITGAAIVGDIAKMPHLLIAGTTGSGKSVCINSMLISILYKSTPEEVRLIMVDPKMVELGNYNGIPHLLIPVVTDPQKAAGALNWAVGEMERRYKLFASEAVRNLKGYNDLMRRKKQSDEEGEWNVLPQIVIVIDELADLMMVSAKEVENSICRIAQKARAAGMHLIVATQRPSANVITGIMKANIPSRIAFAVASQIESRIILDQNGAEKLIGKGDMLFAPLGGGKPTRIQGCFISSDEIEAVIAHIKSTAEAEYNEEILEHIERQLDAAPADGGDFSDEDEDELLPQAIDVVIDSGQASVSMLQRRLKLGYSRAARIVDQMEERGIVGPFEGSKPRQLLISREEWQEMKLRRLD